MRPSTHPGLPRTRRRRARFDPARLLPLLVVAAGLAAYLTSLNGAFVFDDLVHIVQNDRIQSWPPWSALTGKRPLVDLTLAINYHTGGLNPHGYHLVNVAIHLLAGLVLFGLLRRTLLLNRFQDRLAQAAPWIALAAATAWVVHPLQTQSVTYVIQRGESLMGLFYLLTLYCVVRGAPSPAGVLWYVAAVVACAAGMASKAVMVTAPMIVLLYDALFLDRSFADTVRRRWGLHLALASCWGVLWLTGIAPGVLDRGNQAATVGFGFQDVTPAAYALTQVGVVVHYVLLSVWPAPLCLDYGWEVSTSIGAALLPGSVLLLTLAMTAWSCVRRSPLGFLGAWFFVILLPTSSVVPIKDALFEHRMYLSSAALVTLGVLGAWATLEHLADRIAASRATRRAALAVLYSVVFVALLTGTVVRNRVYDSPEAMWRDVTTKRPNNARAFEHLGLVLINEAGPAAALEAYRGGVRADPNFTSIRANLAMALHQTGNLEEAIEHYRAVAEQDPTHIVSRMNMGNALDSLGRTEQAIEAFRSATQVEPARWTPRVAQKLASAHFNLGNVFVRQGDNHSAIIEYEQSVRHHPDNPRVRAALGQILTRVSRFDEAIEQLEAALRLAPESLSTRRLLSAAVRGRNQRLGEDR